MSKKAQTFRGGNHENSGRRQRKSEFLEELIYLIIEKQRRRVTELVIL